MNDQWVKALYGATSADPKCQTTLNLSIDPHENLGKVS